MAALIVFFDQPNFVQYKRNLIDTDLLDYYHVGLLPQCIIIMFNHIHVLPPLPLHDKNTDYTKPPVNGPPT